MTVLFGTIEFGMGFFDYLTTTNLSRVGARTGSTMGNDPKADYNTLQKLSASTSGMPLSNIQFIVIYKATGIGAQPTSACLTASQSGVCNRYVPADFARDVSQFGCDPTDVDRFWCPTTRKVGAGASSTTGPPDYLGVYIKVIHPTYTSMFGSSFTYTDATVIRIEAQTP